MVSRRFAFILTVSAYSLHAIPALAQEAPDKADTIVVSGLREASASITGSDTSLQAHPQSVRVIDEDAIARLVLVIDAPQFPAGHAAL